MKVKSSEVKTLRILAAALLLGFVMIASGCSKPEQITPGRDGQTQSE